MRYPSPILYVPEVVFELSLSYTETAGGTSYGQICAQARFKIDGVRRLYACCNRHGLFEKRI